MSTTSKLGADMTDEQIVELTKQITGWTTHFAIPQEPHGHFYAGHHHQASVDDVLRLARALLARQPAAIDKQAEAAWAVYWGIGEMRKNSVHFERETAEKVAAQIKSNTEIRPLYAAPLANEASKPDPLSEEGQREIYGRSPVEPAAPSVEQDERGASWAPERIWLQRGIGEQGSHTWCEDSIDDCEQAEYMRISRESCPTCHGNDSDLPCAFPEGGKPGCPRDIRLARAASTSANVAQGAEADTRAAVDFYAANPSAALFDFQKRFAAPPAQTALADDAPLVKLFDVLMRQNIETSDESYLSLNCVGVPPTKVEFVAAVQCALTAAQSASASEGK